MLRRGLLTSEPDDGGSGVEGQQGIRGEEEVEEPDSLSLCQRSFDRSLQGLSTWWVLRTSWENQVRSQLREEDEAGKFGRRAARRREEGMAGTGTRQEQRSREREGT